MIKNRSVPPDTILPHVIYENVAEAIAWLSKTYGFVEQYRYGAPDSPDGAQIRLNKAWIMLRSARPGSTTPAQSGFATQSLTVFVDDVPAHLERARAAGAKIVEDLNETFYGERQYGTEDLAGHHWLFAQHVKDVSPEEWGATVSRPPTVDEFL